MNILNRLSFILLVLMFLACSSEDSGLQEDDQNLPDKELVDVKINFTQNSTKLATMFADKVVEFADKKVTLASDVRIQFYDSSGNKSTELTSDSGNVIGNKKGVRVWGDVEVLSEGGVKLNTRSLEWSSTTNLINTDDTVIVRQGRDEIQGVGLVSDVQFENIKIKKNIKGKIHE